jgi:probable HAF family extracellular repeat protein
MHKTMKDSKLVPWVFLLYRLDSYSFNFRITSFQTIQNQITTYKGKHMMGLIKKLLVFVAFSGITASVNAGHYVIKDLGLIGHAALGNIDFLVGDINDHGVISGTAVVANGNRLERMATILDAGAVTTLTGTNGSTYAGGINAAGQVAVTYSHNELNVLSTVWSPDATIPLTVFNDRIAVASDINDHGTVSGSALLSGKETAAVWKDKQLHVLGSLYGDTSSAASINNQGWAVGHSFRYDGGNAAHATLWREGAMIDLGTLGGRYSYANSINDQGDIIGYSQYSPLDYVAHATLWSDGQVIDLGTLGDAGSMALDINNHGLIVGMNYLDRNSNDTTAVLWKGGVLTDINTLLSPDSNWYLSTASAVNNLGQIVGEGFYNGEKRIYMLSYVPEPASTSMLLAGLGLIAAVRLRNQRNA